ncbi:hypothetical protein QFW96_20900 [Saccharopolyspora sp. TS4A08]|uniref:WxL domain-containing protein n=1 Tax=Saccharopolyspora ipomoeae TaxID=3042027 RepID=A0ABT6PTZ2_9PSEU|nr:hypothetical protein [Saccharopolyspora sp. TS4A08]MDI2031103.1 hypothetical protein [Saccharopolyspora sp. TS4A08]
MPSPARRMALVMSTCVLAWCSGGSAATAQTEPPQPRALTITAPTTANLGSAGIGDTVTGQLGTVTASDTTGVPTLTWTATVTSTNFVTGAGTSPQTIPTTAVRYWSGPATSTSGIGTFTPGQPTQANAVTLNSPRTAFSRIGTGYSTASWNPTIQITIPSTAAAGTYSGTITHSLA